MCALFDLRVIQAAKKETYQSHWNSSEKSHQTVLF